MYRAKLNRTTRGRAMQIAAVLLALLTARLVAGDLSAMHRGARVFGSTRAVVIARVDLALGTRVRLGDLRVAKLPAGSLPPGAFATRDDAVGRVVAVPVLAGAAVVDRALAPRRREGLAGIVAPGRRAVRVTTADGLRPEPGSIVDIIATLDSREVGGALEPSVTVVHAARVLSVDAAPDAADSASAGSQGRVGVVVLVTVAEAAHLADAIARGTLMLALAPPEAACANAAPVACRS